MIEPAQVKAELETQLPGVTVQVEGPALVVEPKDLLAAAKQLKNSAAWRLDFLSNLCGVDYPPERLETVYHLYSMEKRHGPLTMKVRVPRAHPHQPSVVSVWRSAEFQEREAYDLYGIVYDGHPDLRRILMWEGFEGHPMRKDYVPEDQDVLEERRG